MIETKAGQHSRPAHPATSVGPTQRRRVGRFIGWTLLATFTVGCLMAPLWYETTKAEVITSA
jgi:hypothetical protein